jgi:hypothetical protein
MAFQVFRVQKWNASGYRTRFFRHLNLARGSVGLSRLGTRRQNGQYASRIYVMPYIGIKYYKSADTILSVLFSFFLLLLNKKLP